MDTMDADITENQMTEPEPETEPEPVKDNKETETAEEDLQEEAVVENAEEGGEELKEEPPANDDKANEIESAKENVEKDTEEEAEEETKADVEMAEGESVKADDDVEADQNIEDEVNDVDDSSQEKTDEMTKPSEEDEMTKPSEEDEKDKDECIFRLNWMLLKNADTDKIVWASTEDFFEILFEEKEAHIPTRAIKCKKIIRSLNFSTSKEIKGFRMEQKVAFKNKCLEEWSFEYGDIQANTTHTWHSLFTASSEHDLMPFDELSGNTVVETAFFNSDGLFNMSTVKLFFT